MNRRDAYDDFYNKTLKVKYIVMLRFALHALALLIGYVTYVRKELKQSGRKILQIGDWPT